jgi:hypothetical protein
LEDKLSVIAKNSSPSASPVQWLVGAKHLEDKLSVIAKNNSPSASPVQLSVGAKHWEDKLSVIAKNSSPNASPVQWLVVRGILILLPFYHKKTRANPGSLRYYYLNFSL